jgi:Rrf2 family protein
MFRISRRLDYGLQLMIALAATTDGTPRPTAYLAKELNIPLPFLHQIGHTLMQAGLVKASPGPHGGLKINQPSDKITVIKIVETLEGNVCINPSNDTTQVSQNGSPCPTSFIWEELQNNILKQLSSVTLAALVQRAKTSPLFDFVFKKL